MDAETTERLVALGIKNYTQEIADILSAASDRIAKLITAFNELQAERNVLQEKCKELQAIVDRHKDEWQDFTNDVTRL